MRHHILFIFLIFVIVSCKKEIIEPTTKPPINSTPIVPTIPINQFKGFVVDPNVKNLGDSYFKNMGVMIDFYLLAYKLLPIGYNSYGLFLTQISGGDFNADGYLDIFDGGVSWQGPKINSSFLIWDTTSKKFIDKKLFKNITGDFYGGNITNAIPIYLNDDNYTDLILLATGDEGIPLSVRGDEPIKIVLSDGKGQYELKDLPLDETEFPLNSRDGGDVGDLNGDNIPDLISTAYNFVYIYWGIKDYPYFTKTNRASFAGDFTNFGHLTNNGFGEKVQYVASNSSGATIIDINKDGKNDIILSSSEDKTQKSQSKILINQGGGKFNSNSIINLPYDSPDNTLGVHNQDYIVDDINNDGLNDIICLTQRVYKNPYSWAPWDIFVYIQNKDGSFVSNKSYVDYTISINRSGTWKKSLIYYDYNKDGKKDISYLNSADKTGEILNKTVFIRNGDRFVEEDFFKYDTIAKNNKNLIK
jgi:hypothetical protein